MATASEEEIMTRHDDTGEQEERDIANRQAALAAEIGRRFLGGIVLRPHARHSGAGEMLRCSARGGVAWQMVADQLPPLRIIDHAWRLVERHGSQTIAWGFVTEPYLTKVDPADAQREVAQYLSGWPVQVHALSRAESSWYPGGCLPIVVLVESTEALSTLIERTRVRA
jgi:hypothetical protein